MVTADPAKRQYRSRLRQEQALATRHSVLDAARELFLERGWSGTGVRDVAAASGVAPETVYAHFSSKKGLLRAVIDHAVVGDDEQVPLGERAEFRALGEGGRSERLAAMARLLAAVHARSAAVTRLLREAAPSDPEISELATAARDLRRRDVAAATELVIGRRPTIAERDGLWALTGPEVYLLLVEESGWTPRRYQQWIEQLLERAVPLS